MDPWSKVDYSRHIREASMEIEGLPAAPVLKRRRRRNREDIGKRGSSFRVSSTRSKFRRKGAAMGATRGPGTPGRDHPPGPATRAPGDLVGPLCPPLGYF